MSAVKYMHEVDIVHGKISPENIIVIPGIEDKIWLASFDYAALRQRAIE